MNRIKYAEQLYALISMCLGCAFIVFGLLSFIGILQPTSTSIVQSQRNIGIVFSVLGVAFLIAQAIFTALASAKKKSYYELISNGIKVNGIVEKVYMLDALNAQYDDIISWADMYDSASMESKKMIVSCLIRRVEVYRDYRLHIDFNIDFEQFSAGLDISAIAA